MRNKIILGLILCTLILSNITIVATSINVNYKKINSTLLNDPLDPYPPTKPDGEQYPRAFIWNQYNTSCIDPEDHQLYIHFDFGNGYSTSSGPYASGETVTIQYYWEEPGDYEFKVLGMSHKYENWYESEWSEPLIVHVQEPYLYPPEDPNGPKKGTNKTEYEFSTRTIDPQGDPIWFKWNFDDNTETEWMGPYESNQLCRVYHSWEKDGIYFVEVKAKDDTGYETDWSYSALEIPKTNAKYSIFMFNLLKDIFDILN